MVFRVIKDKNFITMSNYHLQDSRLSWKAKGILSAILSLPDNWDYSIKGLSSLASDGVTSTTTAVKELESAGYIKRCPVRESGKIIDWEYIIHEQPEDLPLLEKPVVGNPVVVNPVVVNQAQINTYITNKLNNNKEYKESGNLDIKMYPLYEDIFGFWNSKGIITHCKLTAPILQAIAKALKVYTAEDIKKYIDRYTTAYKDDTYYFSYKWTLQEFLSRAGGISAFTDEGSKWLNYIEGNKAPAKGKTRASYKGREAELSAPKDIYNFDDTEI